MAEHSSIEWTNATWNPVTGCSVVSPGCTNCYAMRLAGTRLKNHPSRAGLTIDTKAGPVWNGQVRFNAQWIDQPLRWKKPQMIFVCAHGDLFHEDVPDEWIDQVFAVMALAPHHTFQVLTKRSARMRNYMSRPHGFRDRRGSEDTSIERWCWEHLRAHRNLQEELIKWPWPLPNVWLGVSAEDQNRADERIPDLLATPAAIRFLSAEPLLGPINLRSIDVSGDEEILPLGAGWLDRLEPGEIEHARLDQVIVGGESGQGARPMHPDWARSLRDQCVQADVPFFFKQWGSWLPVYDPEVDDPRGFLRDYCLRNTPKGQWMNHAGERCSTGDRIIRILPVGKKDAGRKLDGFEHNGMPAIGEVPVQ